MKNLIPLSPCLSQGGLIREKCNVSALKAEPLWLQLKTLDGEAALSCTEIEFLYRRAVIVRPNETVTAKRKKVNTEVFNALMNPANIHRTCEDLIRFFVVLEKQEGRFLRLTLLVHHS